MDKPKKGRKPIAVSDGLRKMILASKANGLGWRRIARELGVSMHVARMVCGGR